MADSNDEQIKELANQLKQYSNDTLRQALLLRAAELPQRGPVGEVIAAAPFPFGKMPIVYAQSDFTSDFWKQEAMKETYRRTYGIVEIACGTDITLHGTARGNNTEFDWPFGEQASDAQGLAEQAAKANVREGMDIMASYVRCQRGCRKVVDPYEPTIVRSWVTSTLDLFLVGWFTGHAIAEAYVRVRCVEE